MHGQNHVKFKRK